ncbi:hypothetical protein [Streptomyces sp. NPDC000880]
MTERSTEPVLAQEAQAFAKALSEAVPAGLVADGLVPDPAGH